jgi:carbamoyl-phosphate synthase small subunit
MRGVISTDASNADELVRQARESPGLVGRDLVREVVPAAPRKWEQSLSEWTEWSPQKFQQRAHIVALDYGMKWNIARHLRQLGGDVTILPGTASADEVLRHQPDGLFLSNGPGDPEPLTYGLETIRQLLGKLPIFGICLGHQLLSLACGAKTFKLKFGHRGANQPVLNLDTQRVEITSQNHGFAVEEASLPFELEITHRNLNDDTIAGVRHKRWPAFGVQFHPEASAGPHDSHYLFADFRALVEESLSSAHRAASPPKGDRVSNETAR